MNYEKGELQFMDKLSRLERETCILIGDLDSEWEAVTSIPKDARRMKKMGWNLRIVRHDALGNEIEWIFTAPRRAVLIRKANQEKRQVSEEVRQHLLEIRRTQK